ncbi:hypothetical protein HU200_025279 [Digitaria exilis]|uniref:Prolyl 4-hydroxylase alpha subunit Fe(2+) 2OG dioxygenase domain-containing protein n=1 Tax=Digitaria exilis TaxID=1010633 RepID=A0A835C5I8_9POAL|nr:hypothetical protein HU200_025279 [Digitaria exilis]
MARTTTNSASASPTPAAGDHPRVLIRIFLSRETCKVVSFRPQSFFLRSFSEPYTIAALFSLASFSRTLCLGAAGAGVRAPELRRRRVPPVGAVYVAAAPGGYRLRPPLAPLTLYAPHIETLSIFYAVGARGLLLDGTVTIISLISGKGHSHGRGNDSMLYCTLSDLLEEEWLIPAVCYLNNHGEDYKGGILQFQDGDPSSIIPVAGDVVIYTADSRNVHCVNEVHFLLSALYKFSCMPCHVYKQITVSFVLQVTEGERLTLTVWFTRDRAYDEDPKLLNFLSQTSLNCEPTEQKSYIPLPASDNMYWFSYDQSGFDIRCARVHVLGFSFHSSGGSHNTSALPAEDDPIELLGKQLRLGRGDYVYERIFSNSLHALQVSFIFSVALISAVD